MTIHFQCGNSLPLALLFLFSPKLLCFYYRVLWERHSRTAIFFNFFSKILEIVEFELHSKWWKQYILVWHENNYNFDLFKFVRRQKFYHINRGCIKLWLIKGFTFMILGLFMISRWEVPKSASSIFPSKSRFVFTLNSDINHSWFFIISTKCLTASSFAFETNLRSWYPFFNHSSSFL